MLLQGYRYTIARLPDAQRAGQAYALARLALLAALSGLVSWIAFAQPYPLLALDRHPFFDFYLRTKRELPAQLWLLGAFLLQGLIYALAWRTTRGLRGRGAWALVVGGSLLSSAALLLMAPVGSVDIFDYIVHGRILSHYGANPFFNVGREFPQDPFVFYMGWKGLVSTYGPLWTLLNGAAARLAGDGLIANLLIFKLLSGSFVLASMALVGSLLRRHAPEYALAGVVALGWNPLLLYETFGNGHNDMAMLCCVLAAIWLADRRRFSLAILALVAGALVKFIPLLLLPAFGLVALRELSTLRSRLRFVLLTPLAALALAALAYLPFWRGMETLTILERSDMIHSSLAGVAWALLEPRWGEERAVAVISKTAVLLTLLFTLYQALRAVRSRSWLALPRAACWTLLVYVFFTCLWFQEWYSLWPLALAALMPWDDLLLLAVLGNFAALTRPLIFVPMIYERQPVPAPHWRELHVGPAVLGGVWAVILVYLLACRWRAARPAEPSRRRAASGEAGGTFPASQPALRLRPYSASPAARGRHRQRTGRRLQRQRRGGVRQAPQVGTP